MTQGHEANHSGKFLEDAIEREFRSRKVHVSSWDEGSETPDLFTARRLIRNAPYKSIYGCASRSEFLYNHHPIVTCRIECRWQETSVKIEEKQIRIFSLIEAKKAIKDLIEHGIA